MYVTKGDEREFFFPPEIIVEAGKLGITLSRLREMVRHSTRITHPLGNRRYDEYLFMVEGDRVVAFGLVEEKAAKAAPRVGVKCATCKDSKRILAFDPCEKCHGDGCRYCDQGLVPSGIPCPDCS